VKLLDLIKQFGQANYNYGFHWGKPIVKQFDAERMDLFKQITQQVSVEPVVKPACETNLEPMGFICHCGKPMKYFDGYSSNPENCEDPFYKCTCGNRITLDI